MKAANPVLSGCFPDPSVCRVGEWFYLVNSSFEYLPGLPLHRSRDLVHWEPIGHVVTGQVDILGLASSRGLYAPTLRYLDGLFQVVCTVVDGGGHVLFTAPEAAGPWSAPIWLDGEGIDPSLFQDEDGRVWFHATRPAAEPEWPGQTEIWLREMKDGVLVGPEHVLWTGAVRAAVWSEGPHLYRIGGRYYLLTAEGGTEFHHAVTVARADRVTGPYLGNPSNPVLTHRHLGRGAEVAATGHADLVQAEDGSWWALLLGVRPYGGFHHNLGRETFLVPVSWEDGWPVFAPGEGRVPAEVDVPFAQEHPAPVAGTRVLPEDPAWSAPRQLPTDLATPDGDGWLLPLRPSTLADTAPSSFVGVRQRHRDCEVVVSVDGDLAPGQWAGLAVRQSETDHLTLLTDGTRTRAVVRRGGIALVLGELPESARVCVLRTRGQDYTLLAGPALDQLTEVAVADGRSLDSVSAGGFLGLWIGAHATSGHRPAIGQVRVTLDYRAI